MDKAEEKLLKIAKLINKVNHSNLSSIKETVTRLIKVINDPKSDASDLKKIIEIDPILAIRLLKIANSAYYGPSKTISEIQEAIVFIGFKGVLELALSQKVYEIFNNDEMIDGFSRKLLWKHCVAVAVCGKLIYEKEYNKSGDSIYVAGLLHDFGIIVLDQLVQKNFEYILKKTKETNNNLINLETSLLGYDHTEVGNALVRDWDLPVEIAESVANHHHPEEVEEKYTQMAYTIYVANYIIQQKKIGYCDSPYTDRTIYMRFLRKLGIMDMNVDKLTEEVNLEIKKMEEANWF
jgi:HD-like signal output (HDOD) protein